MSATVVVRRLISGIWAPLSEWGGSRGHRLPPCSASRRTPTTAASRTAKRALGTVGHWLGSADGGR
jgi:hypothetical protein